MVGEVESAVEMGLVRAGRLRHVSSFEGSVLVRFWGRQVGAGAGLRREVEAHRTRRRAVLRSAFVREVWRKST